MHATKLHATPLVTITDIRCRPDHPDCGDEECSRGHHIVFPRNGVFVKHVRGGRVVADAGHVLFFNAGEPYRVSHPVPGGDDCTVFAFDTDVLLDVLGEAEPAVRDKPERPFDLTHDLIDPGMLLPQRALRHRIVTSAASALEVEEASLLLLRNIVGAMSRKMDAPSRKNRRAASARLQSQWIEATKLLLAARPQADVTLTDIAREVYCSPFHLARLFRNTVGIPIHQYQTRARLVLALERLLDRSDNLVTLALDLGFSSHSHFTAAFRRSFGISPSAFRSSANGRALREMRKNLTVSPKGLC